MRLYAALYMLMTGEVCAAATDSRKKLFLEMSRYDRNGSILIENFNFDLN